VPATEDRDSVVVATAVVEGGGYSRDSGGDRVRVYKGRVCPKGVAAPSTTAKLSLPLTNRSVQVWWRGGGEIKGKSTACTAVATAFHRLPRHHRQLRHRRHLHPFKFGY